MEKVKSGILMVCLAIFYTTISPKKQSDFSHMDSNYRWDEITARNKINQEIRKKFGSESSIWWRWPFLSRNEIEKKHKKNKEIKEIQNIVDSQINSSKNFKRITKTIVQKKWHRKKLKTSVSIAICKFIEKKSYDYALHKSGNTVIADIVRKIITKKIKTEFELPYAPLARYLGKERERLIDRIIRKIRQQERRGKN